jgi:hypothetical protein
VYINALKKMVQEAAGSNNNEMKGIDLRLKSIKEEDKD